MKSSPSRQDLTLDEQAATWAARLEGGVLESSERVALDAWLAEAPAHRAALSHYCQFSADLEEQLPVLVAAGAVKMPAPKKPRGKLLHFPRVMAVALAAAAAVAVAVWVTRPAAAVENFANAPMQRSAHTLADGTRVELNANTSLRFENTAHERRVRLAGGEAIFMVTKDPSRPFIIETPAGSVKVTGTTFNVRTEAADSSLEVTVVEGSVEVRPREATEAPFKLKANDRLSAKARHVEVHPISASELDDTLAWRKGQIVFNGTPLAEAVARYARYQGRSITYPPELAAEPLGGQFSIDDITGFLSAIEGAFQREKAIIDPNGAITIR